MVPDDKDPELNKIREIIDLLAELYKTLELTHVPEEKTSEALQKIGEKRTSIGKEKRYQNAIGRMGSLLEDTPHPIEVAKAPSTSKKP